jgi:hypothetical protein
MRLLGLLLLRSAPVAAEGAVPKQSRKANFAVNLLHTLKVGLGSALGSEDNILLNPVVSDQKLRERLRETYHFLESESLGLGNEEPDKCGSERGEAPEQDVCAVLDLLQHVWRDLSDDEVVHPVGRSPKGNAIGASAERPNLGDENPGTRLSTRRVSSRPKRGEENELTPQENPKKITKLHRCQSWCPRAGLSGGCFAYSQTMVTAAQPAAGWSAH